MKTKLALTLMAIVLCLPFAFAQAKAPRMSAAQKAYMNKRIAEVSRARIDEINKSRQAFMSQIDSLTAKLAEAARRQRDDDDANARSATELSRLKTLNGQLTDANAKYASDITKLQDQLALNRDSQTADSRRTDQDYASLRSQLELVKRDRDDRLADMRAQLADQNDRSNRILEVKLEELRQANRRDIERVRADFTDRDREKLRGQERGNVLKAVSKLRRLSSNLDLGLTWEAYNTQLRATKIETEEILLSIPEGDSKRAVSDSLKAFVDAHWLWRSFLGKHQDEVRDMDGNLQKVMRQYRLQVDPMDANSVYTQRQIDKWNVRIWAKARELLNSVRP